MSLIFKEIIRNLDKDPTILKLQNKYYNFYVFSFLKLIISPYKIKRYLNQKFIFFVNLYIYFKSQKKIKSPKNKILNNDIFLIICLQGLPYQYVQIWNILKKKLFNNYEFHALSYKKNYLTNFYLKVLSIKIFYLEDITKNNQKFNLNLSDLMNLKTEKDYLEYKINDLEIGKITLGTYFRSKCSGEILINNENKKDIDRIIISLHKNYFYIKIFLNSSSYKVIFITEIFIEEYALIANIALKNNIKLFRYNFTAKDDSMIINRITHNNYRKHHASITRSTFNKIKKKNFDYLNKIVLKNFDERYSDKWSLSNRNQLSMIPYTKKDIYKKLNIDPNKKIGIIFSHILYDLIYSYGKDVYYNYFNWLGNTMRIVSELKNTHWLLKIHPANLWRNEINNQLKGKYEEEKVLKKFLGKNIPSNIQLISHETSISPLELMKIGDACITIRGTAAVEMATMGKTIISAGTGRFDDFNFVNIAKNSSEYEKMLKNFDNGNMSEFYSKEKIIENSKIFYYGLFHCKAIKLPFINTTIQNFKKKALSMDDFNYLYDQTNEINSKNLKDYVLKDDYEGDLLDESSI
jgi:hypothetical protein